MECRFLTRPAPRNPSSTRYILLNNTMRLATPGSAPVREQIESELQAFRTFTFKWGPSVQTERRCRMPYQEGKEGIELASDTCN